MTAVKLAIVGMGMIGKRHLQAMRTIKEAELIAIVDPAEQAKAIALNEGVRWFAKIEEMLPEMVPEGVIVCTPTEIHLAPTLSALEVDAQSFEVRDADGLNRFKTGFVLPASGNRNTNILCVFCINMRIGLSITDYKISVSFVLQI